MRVLQILLCCLVSTSLFAQYAPTDDYDGDGYINSVDIDDDNDGITDDDEASCRDVYGWSAEGTATFLVRANGLPSLSVGGTASTTNSARLSYANKQINIGLLEPLEIGDTVSLYVAFQGALAEYSVSSSITNANGTYIDDTTLARSNYSPTNPADDKIFIFNYIVKTGGIQFIRLLNTSGGVMWIDGVYMRKCNYQQDYDGDGIANKFDLDSDGDGCPDATEASGDFMISDLKVSTSTFITNNVDIVKQNFGDGVNTSGLPTTSPFGGTMSVTNLPTYAYETDKIAECNCEPGFVYYTDTDGDSYPDPCDKDDDNDGILDEEEGFFEYPTIATCRPPAYVFFNRGAANSKVATIDLLAQKTTFIQDLPFKANAFGYNYHDGLFYAYSAVEKAFVAYNVEDNTYTKIHSLPGFTDDYNAGDVDIYQKLYFAFSQDRKIVIIDVDPTSPTYQQSLGVNDGNFSVNIPDFVFNPADSMFYGIRSDVNPTPLMKFDPSGYRDGSYTGNAVSRRSTVGTVSGLPSGTKSYGAGYADANGNLYFNDNNSGEIYRINTTATDFLTNPTATYFSRTMTDLSGADGAKCTYVDVYGEVTQTDSDKDGIEDHLDWDSDNDGVADVLEAGGTDLDSNGMVGTGVLTASDVNSDGIPLAANSGNGITPRNSDSDNLPDYIDIDSDNDGIVDAIESQPTTNYKAPTGLDADGDGIDDAFDTDAGGSFTGTLEDTDGDNTPDLLDDDSDGDGDSDMLEAEQGVYATGDADKDGLADVFDLYSLVDSTGGTNSDNRGQTATNPFPNEFAGHRTESNWRDIYWLKYNCTEKAWQTNNGNVILDANNFLPYTMYPNCCDSVVIDNCVAVSYLLMESCDTLNITSTLEVLDTAINKGAMILNSLSETEYGQYLGPAIDNLEMNMLLNENGWHNLGFPVGITANEFAVQNNTVDNPDFVNLTGTLDKQNLQWYDSKTSVGKENGFFINRNGTNYSSHAYGTWNVVTHTESLSTRGYNFYIDDAFSHVKTIKARGRSNDKEKSYVTSDNFGGWNLIPNIYPVTISTKKMFDDGFFDDFDKAVWIWDPGDPNLSPLPGKFSSGAYIAFDPETGAVLNAALASDTGLASDFHTTHIAPFQSFYVRRTTASKLRRKDLDLTNNMGVNPAVAIGSTTDLAASVTGSDISVTMKPEYREACQTTKHYKTNGSQPDFILLRTFESENPNLSDMIELAFDDVNYTYEMDPGYDIEKMSAQKNAPFLFSVLHNKALMINKMPYPKFNTSVPIGFVVEKNATYHFNVAKQPLGWKLYLEDLKTGELHDFSEGDYTFTNDMNYNSNRFVLHFNKNGEPIYSVKQNANVWPTEFGFTFSFENFIGKKADIYVSNAIGQLIYQESNVATEELYSINFTNKTDPMLYLITIVSNNYTQTIKVVR